MAKPTSGLLLDDRYKYALLSQAVSEHLAKVDQEIGALFTNRGFPSRALEQALESILLFGKAYLHGVPRGINLDRLISEDLVEIVDSSPEEQPGTLGRGLSYGGSLIVGSQRDMEDLILLKPFLLSKLKKLQAMVDLDTKYGSRTWLNFVWKAFIADYGRAQTIDYRYSSKEEIRFANVAWAFIDEWRGIRSLYEKSSSLGIPALIDPPSRCKITRQEQDSIQRFGRMYKSFPIIDSTVSATPSNSRSSVESAYISRQSADLALRACEIYLDEVEVAPRLSNIEDVLRLRNDKRLLAFRDVLFSWASELRLGNSKAEARMRVEIRKANKELTKLGRYRKISRWTSYLALPVAVIETLSLGVPLLGTSLTMISGAVQLRSDLTEAKHRWILLGR